MDITNLDTLLTGIPRLDEDLSRRGYQCILALAWPPEPALWHRLREAFEHDAPVRITPDRRVWPWPSPLSGFLTEIHIEPTLHQDTERRVKLTITPTG